MQARTAAVKRKKKNGSGMPAKVSKKVVAREAESGPYDQTLGRPLGLHIGSVNQAIRTIKEGLSATVWARFSRESGLSSSELAQYAGITPRTLARRMKEGRFAAEESERLLRLSTLFEKARGLFKNTDEAMRWLKAPKIAFNGKSPLQYADTALGAREVEDLLGRLEHGVFS